MLLILDYIFRELAVGYLDHTDLAHVKPEGASFDDLGRGSDEGVSNFKELSRKWNIEISRGSKADKPTGYLRKRLPQELVVLQRRADKFLAPDNSNLELDVEVNTLVRAPDGEMAVIDARTKAKMQGYARDHPCGDCENYTLVRNGTCMKCNTCGATSGCS